MSDKKIDQLPIISELTGNEMFPLYGGVIYKSSIDKIRDYIEQDIKQNTIEETDKRYLKLSGGELKADSITTPLTLICTNN